jgi:hypothetical protein
MIDHDNPGDLSTAELIKFHKFIGSLICEDIGHEWTEITINAPDDNGWANAMNTFPVEKCRRCGVTRQNISDASTTNGGINSNDIRL